MLHTDLSCEHICIHSIQLSNTLFYTAKLIWSTQRCYVESRQCKFSTSLHVCVYIHQVSLQITWTTKCFLAQVKIIHRMIATERKISYETQETVIGYLPLSHILPQLLDIYVTIVSGGSCWFSQPNPEKVC